MYLLEDAYPQMHFCANVPNKQVEYTKKIVCHILLIRCVLIKNGQVDTSLVKSYHRATTAFLFWWKKVVNGKLLQKLSCWNFEVFEWKTLLHKLNCWNFELIISFVFFCFVKNRRTVITYTCRKISIISCPLSRKNYVA